MKLYEFSYLISPEISEQEARELQTKMISLIQKEGGVLVREKYPSKKKLAYPVKKNFQAFLAIINFQILPEKLANLEKEIKAEKQILRYLILTKLPLKKAKISRPSAFKKSKMKKEKKADIKEIEKRLDEILE